MAYKQIAYPNVFLESSSLDLVCPLMKAVKPPKTRRKSCSSKNLNTRHRLGSDYLVDVTFGFAKRGFGPPVSSIFMQQPPATDKDLTKKLHSCRNIKKCWCSETIVTYNNDIFLPMTGRLEIDGINMEIKIFSFLTQSTCSFSMKYQII